MEQKKKLYFITSNYRPTWSPLVNSIVVSSIVGMSMNKIALCTGADPGFLLGGGANPLGGAPTYDFVKFSKKLHEIEKILGRRGARTRCAPQIHHCKQQVGNLLDLAPPMTISGSLIENVMFISVCLSFRNPHQCRDVILLFIRHSSGSSGWVRGGP